jgi:hypothetical protein
MEARAVVSKPFMVDDLLRLVEQHSVPLTA